MVPKYNHKYPYRRKAEGDHSDGKREDDVKIEAEIGGMQSQAKECQQPSEARRGKEWILP